MTKDAEISWESEKSDFCQGWHTWHNDSVLSYIQPLEGIGIRLCIKDYKNSAFLENALIGEENTRIVPKAHAYDDSYAELSLSWKENHVQVISALCDGDLCIYVRCDDKRLKPSTLLIQGISLYNMGGMIAKDGATLRLQQKGTDITVFLTREENGELYVPLATPYLSVSLTGEIGISTGRKRTLKEIIQVIENQRSNYQKNLKEKGELASLYQAMQTCQAWDTIYDPILHSPITTVSRIWNKQWGGYVLFCWDTYFGALMQSIDNKVLAYCNVFAITNMATEEGFVPNYASQNGFKSFDRSQPPVGSMICMDIYNRYKELWFLKELFPKLLKWNRWFIKHRCTKNGLLAWGSEPYEKMYEHPLEYDGVNDRQGAAYESGLDNSPMYDNIPFDKQTHMLQLDDVGLTGLYIKDCYALADMAEVLNLPIEREELIQRAEQLEEKMEELWDEETGLYLNRRTDTGEFEKRLSPFHFHALFSKRVSKERINRMINEHLLNPNEFWTNYPLPSIAKSDPSYVKQTYWQGRVWAPMNYLVFCALQQAGREDVSEALAKRSAELLMKEWTECGHVHENYDPETGEGCNNERSDKFYHWGGLLGLMSFCNYRK